MKPDKRMLEWDFRLVRVGYSAILDVECNPEEDPEGRSRKLVPTSEVVSVDETNLQIETLNTIYQG